MCTDETTTYESPDDSSQGTYEAPDGSEQGTYEAPEDGTPGWSRRTFLKAAALGTAAAALVNLGGNGGSFGASSVLAHTDTKSSCTANDIEVSGGEIINEPCLCNGTTPFQAVARFLVTNNNNATRKCITLHLGAGGTLGGQDYLLFDAYNPATGQVSGGSNISGNGTSKFMYAALGTLPCNFGTECYAGSVVAFQTAQNQSDAACTGPITKYPGGQCRRQEICIYGFDAALACTSNCSPDCGGTATLTASVETEPVAAGQTPFTYVLSVTGQPDQTYGPTADTSHDFAVTVATSVSCTLKVYDSRKGAGCFRSAGPIALDANPIEITSASGTPPTCAGGNSTLTASANSSGSITYTFSEGTTTLGSVTSSTGTGSISVLLSSGPHTIKVVASNGSCSDDDTFQLTVPDPVQHTLELSGQGNCNGQLTYSSVASGGNGSYTFTWRINGSVVTTGVTTVGNTSSLSYPPKLDGQCYAISCQVADTGPCPSTSGPNGSDTLTRTISQCVTNTENCS